jgi:D-amino-acid dehydrogenase
VAEAADVIVVGGGIAGMSVAYHLVIAGASTTVVDRHHEGRATDAGAGILSPETTRVVGEGWPELAVASGARYRRLVAELEAEGETDLGYGRTGLLAVAFADWDVEAYEQLAARSVSASVVEVSPTEAAARFPALAPVTRALWNPDAARVDGRRFTAALRRSAVRHGLVEVGATAERIVLDGGRAVAVEAGGTRVACGAVVVAGGAWTPALVDPLGDAAVVPVGPERGQLVHLHAPGLDTDDWPIVSPPLGCYVVPWPGGRAVVGATREPEAGFAPVPTVDGVRMVLNEVARVAPGLVHATLVEVRVGLRPACRDGLPVLGRLPGLDNVYAATGYGADGLLVSPGCGQLIAREVLSGPEPGVDPFRPDRFL